MMAQLHNKPHEEEQGAVALLQLGSRKGKKSKNDPPGSHGVDGPEAEPTDDPHDDIQPSGNDESLYEAAEADQDAVLVNALKQDAEADAEAEAEAEAEAQTEAQTNAEPGTTDQIATHSTSHTGHTSHDHIDVGIPDEALNEPSVHSPDSKDTAMLLHLKEANVQLDQATAEAVLAENTALAEAALAQAREAVAAAAAAAGEHENVNENENEDEAEARKRKVFDTSHLAEFLQNNSNQWAGYLTDEALTNENQFDLYEAAAAAAAAAAEAERNAEEARGAGPKPKKLKRSKKRELEAANVDPELAQLSGAEVQQAMLNAGLALSVDQQTQAAAAAAVAAHMEFLRKKDKPLAASGQPQRKDKTLPGVSTLRTMRPAGRPMDLPLIPPMAVGDGGTGSGAAVGSTGRVKMFSKEEIATIDRFIEQYCQVNGLTRQQICERVWSNERRKDDFWESLQKVLPHRTRASLYKHVRRAYHVFDVRGKWTPEDDELLAKLVTEKKSQWKLISKELGRMPEDCRDRWRNYVKCGDQRAQSRWTEEEETQLINVIREMQENHTSINWTVVSEKMGGTRSRIQCRYKWNKLVKREMVEKVRGMDEEYRVLLLQQLKALGYPDESSVDWEEILRVCGIQGWTPNEVKVAYERLRNSVRDHKSKTFPEILDSLLQDLDRGEPVGPNTQYELAVLFQDKPHTGAETAMEGVADVSGPQNGATTSPDVAMLGSGPGEPNGGLAASGAVNEDVPQVYGEANYPDLNWR